MVKMLQIFWGTKTVVDIVRHVDEEDRLKERIVLSGQNREVILINESGFYSLILRSEMPKAKQFKRWVTAEVLPQIRKTGGYSPNNQLALSEFKVQVIAMVNDIVSEKINEVEDKCSEFYKINAAKKYDVSQYIKRRLGINKANDEYHQVKDRVFLLLNVTKWEDIDIDTFKESIDIIDESIRVIKMERPYEQTRFNL
ncbi:MAG: Bro-N domain-containing protein [Clostridium saudiense]|nr:Bro-N domain-containing protein [Clostridium saudiense]